ncbi:hypothetical protein [Acidithiobacillus sp.]|uniref:hypothetical protein n=1 Tax=Acidithiobacillus sp. TaxID=1872118 RepID=UPI00262D7989|nr:hypothetical protein [Acidithiobacillus sp.]MDD2750128.1 hypothetical protein [Acidithiobacillus sp.]MDD5280421.1 hypothetical protein [Acidithiobacillus sp.]
MSTKYDEDSLSTALDIIENIESRYGRLADRLGEVRKSMPSENIETISDKCFELSVEIMRYKHYFSSVKKLVVGRQDIGFAQLS